MFTVRQGIFVVSRKTVIYIRRTFLSSSRLTKIHARTTCLRNETERPYRLRLRKPEHHHLDAADEMPSFLLQMKCSGRIGACPLLSRILLFPFTWLVPRSCTATYPPSPPAPKQLKRQQEDLTDVESAKVKAASMETRVNVLSQQVEQGTREKDRVEAEVHHITSGILI